MSHDPDPAEGGRQLLVILLCLIVLGAVAFIILAAFMNPG